MLIKRRLASKEEYLQLFLVCAFPVHVWAILVLMKRAGAIFLPLNLFQIVSVVAYVLVFALLESLVIFGILFLVSLILPEKFFRSQLVPVGTVAIGLASIVGILIHFYEPWEIEFMEFDLWASLWVAIALVSAALFMVGLRRAKRLETWARAFGEKLAILSAFYLIFDFLGLCVIIIRNVS